MNRFVFTHKILLIPLALCLIINRDWISVLAESYSNKSSFIEGDVYDVCNGKPLQFVKVQFGNGETQQTNENGHYRYKLDANNYTISLDVPGYLRDDKPLTLAPDQTKYAVFPLAPPKGCQALNHAGSYKAVIILGGGPTIFNSPNGIWSYSQALADKAYKSLKLQGYGDANIAYLSGIQLDVDVDGDGHPDIDGISDMDNVQFALTKWAGDVEDVVVYLIGHGGDGIYQLTRETQLSAIQLNTWLDTLQKQIKGKLVVVIDSCYSGSFIPPLAAPNRYVITSTSADRQAVVSNVGGSTSFSYYFWDEVVFSSQLREAYRKARQSMSGQLVGNGKVQKAMIDANGDQVETLEDYSAIEKYCFGTCKSQQSVTPEIASISPQESLNGQLQSLLSATISAENPIAKAWATIQRPDYNFPKGDTAINSLPQMQLSCKDKVCQGVYNNFNMNGDYVITFYVEDSKGNVSLPRSVTLKQSGRDKNEANADAVYEATTGLLIIKDVAVGNQHYYVELQDMGKYSFSLATGYAQQLAGQTRPNYATYNITTKELQVPKIWANGQFYFASLTNNGSFVFNLQSVGSSTVQ